MQPQVGTIEEDRVENGGDHGRIGGEGALYALLDFLRRHADGTQQDGHRHAALEPVDDLCQRHQALAGVGKRRHIGIGRDQIVFTAGFDAMA